MGAFWRELKSLFEKHGLTPKPSGGPYPPIEIGVTDPCSGTFIDPKDSQAQQWRELCNILLCRRPELSRGFFDYGPSVQSIQAKLIDGTWSSIINLGDDPLHAGMTVFYVVWA